MNKKAQEEMVGFAVILIIVAVIVVILIGFMVRTKSTASYNSYEIEGFLDSSLQYTTSCSDYLGTLDLEHLIVSCSKSDFCLDERPSCEVLNNTLKGIIDESWNVGQDSYIKGYYFEIFVNGNSSLILEKGNKTGIYTGGSQDFASSGKGYDLILNLYT